MVEIKDVHKKFSIGESTLWALQGVSLEIAKGEMLALSGSSGSGKTTLLNLIGALDTPTKGSLSVNGKNTASLNQDQLADLRATTLGYVFQTFNLLPVLTALENVEYPLIRLEKNAAKRLQLCQEALAKVGLASHANHRPDQLSGGQRQRVAIARALIHQPSLIVADEPTANLDSKTSGEVLDLLQKLNREMGQTVVIASHDPSVLERCSRTITLVDGRVVS